VAQQVFVSTSQGSATRRTGRWDFLLDALTLAMFARVFLPEP